MKCLVWRWMFAVALVGLMVRVPLLAEDTDPNQEAGGSGNYYDALAIAKANVNAALKNVKQDPDKAKITAKLKLVIEKIDDSTRAWKNSERPAPGTIAHPEDEVPATLDKQIDAAAAHLKIGRAILDRLADKKNGKNSSDHYRELLLPVMATLNVATNALQEARGLIPKEQVALTSSTVGVGTHPQSGDQAAKDSATIADQAKADADKQAKEQEAARLSQTHRLFGVAGLAVLLAVIAIVLVFLPVGPVARLRSDKFALQDQLKSLTSQHSILREDLESLSKQKDDLNKKIKKLTDAAKVTDQVPQEEWTRERRTSERRKSSGVGGGSGAVAAVFVESARDGSQVPKRANLDEASEEDDLRALPVKAVPKARVPLADYNDARAKKPADRATEFSQQYAKQTAMTCSNPQVRNNGAFTDLRFREDQLGKFLAVEHGKELLLFPELNYDYSTGRKTLEGVFQYPDVESTAYRLTQPATVEKRGEEWALTRQGVFQNG